LFVSFSHLPELCSPDTFGISENDFREMFESLFRCIWRPIDLSLISGPRLTQESGNFLGVDTQENSDQQDDQAAATHDKSGTAAHIFNVGAFFAIFPLHRRSSSGIRLQQGSTDKMSV